MPRIPASQEKKPRRDDILDHATRLFAERGYEGASMGDLAELCGMRKASLFYHFESKDVLYVAVLDRLVSAVSEAIVKAASAEGSFLERLDTLSDAITSVLGQQPFAARIILRDAMDGGKVLQGTLGDSVQMALGMVETFLGAGQAAGAFAPGDVKQLIVSLIGIHFMPFGISKVVERFMGEAPFGPAFIAARRDAVREQVRALLGAKRGKRKADAP